MVQLLKSYSVLLGILECLGGAILILIVLWIVNFREGFSLNKSNVFNWHPLLMTAGMIYIYGNASLIYRTFPGTRKKKLKIIHTVLQLSNCILSATGIAAVFKSHALDNYPDMYSLHSWIGISLITCMCTQWLISLITFLVPNVLPSVRAMYLPLHVFFGVGSIVLTTITALTGLTEKAIFSIKNYSEIPWEGVIVNLIGIMIIFFLGILSYMLTNPKYKRQPLPEDQMLLTAKSTHSRTSSTEN